MNFVAKSAVARVITRCVARKSRSSSRYDAGVIFVLFETSRLSSNTYRRDSRFKIVKRRTHRILRLALRSNVGDEPHGTRSVPRTRRAKVDRDAFD